MLSDSTILKHIVYQPKHAAGFKQLVRELDLHGDGRGDLDSRLQKLVAAGELVRLNSDRYALPQCKRDPARVPFYEFRRSGLTSSVVPGNACSLFAFRCDGTWAVLNDIIPAVFEQVSQR